MPHFLKYLGKLLLWLLLSEIMCLFLAFSFAIIGGKIAAWLGQCCNLTAHLLLLTYAASNLARDSVADYRRNHCRIRTISMFLLAFWVAFPQWLLTTFFLCTDNESLIRNLFPSAEAMFLQIHVTILQSIPTGNDFFSWQLLMLYLPPLVTVFSVFFGFSIPYGRWLAAEDAKRNHA